MMIDMVGLDADDTLWQNEFIYHQAKEKFKRLLGSFQDPEQIQRRLDDLEVENIAFYGYGIKSFGLSMVEAALEVSAGRLDPSDLVKLIAIIKEMLRTDVPLMDHAEGTLRRLASRIPLLLITKGDTYEQERKIRRSGLAEFFHYIEIVGEKTEGSYRCVLEKVGINPTRFLMVGNSMKSDILPVLKLGGQAVYIPNHQTWFHEEVEASEIGDLKFGQVGTLEELPEYLELQYFRHG